jgi:hypothetical protein
VCQRAIERYRASNSASSCNRCLSGTEYTDIYGWYVAAVETTANHVKPLIAALTLDHWLPIIGTVAYTSSALTRETTAIGRWGGQAVSVGRGMEGVGERIVVAKTMRCGGVDHVRRSLSPALVVCFQCVLRRSFCCCQSWNTSRTWSYHTSSLLPTRHHFLQSS